MEPHPGCTPLPEPTTVNRCPNGEAAGECPICGGINPENCWRCKG
jgi:hypothetical protein